jgi:hypothetical protein
LGTRDGRVDTVDARLGRGQAEEAVAMLLGVVRECPACERIGPRHRRRRAADWREGVQVRLAAGAGDDVRKRLAVLERSGEALIGVDMAGEHQIGKPSGGRERAVEHLAHRDTGAVVAIDRQRRMLRGDE